MWERRTLLDGFKRSVCETLTLESKSGSVVALWPVLEAVWVSSCLDLRGSLDWASPEAKMLGRVVYR
jgi:hypothetical protein